MARRLTKLQVLKGEHETMRRELVELRIEHMKAQNELRRLKIAGMAMGLRASIELVEYHIDTRGSDVGAATVSVWKQIAQLLKKELSATIQRSWELRSRASR
ncbi:MAG: hypothetical protein ACE5F1_01410 [Planctomycetota bacterium]